MVMEERWKNNIMLSENNNIMSLSENDNYLYLIVSFWYASAAYQASLVEPWFVFWRDADEPKYPWRDQTSLICRQSVPKRYD